MKKITLFLVCLVFAGVNVLWAQNVQVSGVVTDATGPLPGVVIVAKGTSVRTITDANGHYSLSVPSNAVLVVSSMGFVTQEVAVNGRTDVDIVLIEEAIRLDDVVVVGYGSQRKGNITGNVGTVKAAQLEDLPTASFQQMLQGTTPGVQVVANTGRPSAGATIRIRGVGSISAGTDPLYVMDGIPVSSTDFASINANDIESISILKDAVATSIYGSRGANGVIVITTKRGKTGDARVEARVQVGWLTRTQDKFEMMNSTEKLSYEKMLGVGKGVTLSDAEIAGYPINVNWQEEVMSTGFFQSYELSVSGGTEKTHYYLSGQYYDIDGIVLGSDMTRYSGRANVEYKAKKWLTIADNLSIGTYKENVARTDRNVLNPFNYAYKAEPYYRPFNDDGSYNFDGAPDDFNIFEQTHTNIDYNTTLRLINSASAEITFTDDLKFKSILGTDYAQAIRYYYIWPQAKLSTLNGYNGLRTDAFSNAFNIVSTNTLSFTKTFAERHNVSAMAAFEALNSTTKNFNAQKRGFPNERVDAMNSGATPFDISGVETGYSVMSYFLNTSYNFDSRYIVEALIRRDGSSRFGPNNRWATFWAIGGAWNAHNEEFIKSIDQISKLKFSVNYGTQGNASIPNYQWRGTYSYGKYNDETSAYPARIPNEDLTWEKSSQFSAGFQLGLWAEKLQISFDYFNRKTTDMLMAAQLSRTSGFSSRTENIGEMKNTGIEATVDFEAFKNQDWRIGLKASVSTVKNEVTKLYNGDDIRSGVGSVLLIREGLPLYNYMMVRYAGVNPVNGEALYYDKNGKVVNEWNADNAVVEDGKTPIPTVFGGFDLSVSWKQLELSANFYYSLGNYIYNHVSFFTLGDGAGASTSNMDKRLLTDSWKKPGDVTSIPRQSASNTSQISDRYLEDGSYLRLRNLTVAYTLPKDIVSKLKLERVRIYAQGQNLWTLTKFTGFDPEVGTPPAGGVVGYINDFNYPASKTFTLGIDIGF